MTRQPGLKNSTRYKQFIKVLFLAL